MTETPDFFAARPDALSEVLTAIRLQGAALLRCATTGRIHVPAGRRMLHIVEEGPVQLWIGGGQTTLAAGDMALLMRRDAREIGTAGSPRPLGPADLIRDRPSMHAGPCWLTGSFDANDADDLLTVLPPVVIVRGSPTAAWFDLSVSLMVAELVDTRPGAMVMIARILDLLLVHVLRSWSAQDSERTPGWLTAALDPQISRAIAALHHDLARAWTVGEHADHALLSRTVFAERFTRLAGTSPMAYLTARRLARAAQLLRTSTTSVAEIGASVGYASEAAFSRAFARRYGAPPLRWRSAATR